MKTEARSFIHFGAVQLTVTGLKGDKTVYVKVTDVAPGTHQELKDPKMEPFAIPMWENELKLFLIGDELIYEACPRKVGLELGDVVHALINYNDLFKWICVFGVVPDDEYIRITRNLPTQCLTQKNQQWKRDKDGSRRPVNNEHSRKSPASGYDLAQAFNKDNKEAYSTEDEGPRREDVVSVEEVPDIREGRRHHQPARRHQQQRPHQRSQAA